MDSSIQKVNFKELDAKYILVEHLSDKFMKVNFWMIKWTDTAELFFRMEVFMMAKVKMVNNIVKENSPGKMEMFM